MKKLLFILATVFFSGVVLLEFPWWVYAAPQAHVWYLNRQPHFTFDVAWSNFTSAPFHVYCNLYAVEPGVGYWEVQSTSGPFISKNKNMRVLWSGTDVSSTTLRSQKVKITYPSGGYKEMNAFVTDGTSTEAVSCGGIQIQPAPVAPITNIIVKPNGTRIEY